MVLAGAVLALPVLATNPGTENGVQSTVEEACTGSGLKWFTKAILTEDTAQIPEDLRKDLPGEKDVAYSNAGYFAEVTPALDNGPGIFELNHFNVPQANQQVWRIPTATDHTIENATVTISLPDNLPEGATVRFDGVATTSRMPLWGGHYASYSWQETPADSAVDNGDGTWTINLGTLPAGEARVYSLIVDMSSANTTVDNKVQQPWRTTPYVAEAVLTGSYVDGEENGPCPTPTENPTPTEEPSEPESPEPTETDTEQPTPPAATPSGPAGGTSVAGNDAGSSDRGADQSESDSSAQGQQSGVLPRTGMNGVGAALAVGTGVALVGAVLIYRSRHNA